MSLLLPHYLHQKSLRSFKKTLKNNSKLFIYFLILAHQEFNSEENLIIKQKICVCVCIKLE